MTPERDEPGVLWAVISLAAIAIMVLLLGDAPRTDGIPKAERGDGASQVQALSVIRVRERGRRSAGGTAVSADAVVSASPAQSLVGSGQ